MNGRDGDLGPAYEPTTYDPAAYVAAATEAARGSQRGRKCGVCGEHVPVGEGLFKYGGLCCPRCYDEPSDGYGR